LTVLRPQNRKPKLAKMLFAGHKTVKKRRPLPRLFVKCEMDVFFLVKQHELLAVVSRDLPIDYCP